MKWYSVRPITTDPQREFTAVRFHEATRNSKLAPVEHQDAGANAFKKTRPVASGPFCSATYASIDATCSDACVFKAGACYVRSGFTGRMSRALDEIAYLNSLKPLDVAIQEAALIVRSFGGGAIPQDGGRNGGRPLRLHIGGDARDSESARVLARAAANWLGRGGGPVWSYTHSWREMRRFPDWGPINILASVETVQDALLALGRGFVPAITVERHTGRRRWKAAPKLHFLPCPAETTPGVTCVQCRLCLDERGLRRRQTGIAFALHGSGAKKVRLPVVHGQ